MVKGCLSILKFSGKALCTPFLFLPFLARAQEPSELLPAPRTVVSGPAINVATTFRIANSVPAFNKQIDAFVEYGHAAIHVAVAGARIGRGWTPGGPN